MTVTASFLVALLVAALTVAAAYQGGRGRRRTGEATNPHDSLQLRPHDR